MKVFHKSRCIRYFLAAAAAAAAVAAASVAAEPLEALTLANSLRKHLFAVY